MGFVGDFFEVEGGAGCWVDCVSLVGMVFILFHFWVLVWVVGGEE